MGNFKDKLARFMYGRYGTDQLYNALNVLCLVLIVFNFFIHSTILTTIISLSLFAVLTFMIFRTLSKNIYKRRSENEKFLKLWRPFKAKSSFTIRRVKEIKTHRFRRCPHCKKVLRLPRRTGKHTVNCPCCHKDFELNILF